MELSLKVIHAGPSSFLVNNTLVMGEKEAVLIDVPFTFMMMFGTYVNGDI